MITLPNILTTEERLQVPRLLDHDAMGFLTEAREGIKLIRKKNKDGYDDYIASNVQLAIYIQWAVEIL